MIVSSLPFQNQQEAFQKVENSIGQLVILDALAGYGKTAFLKTLEEEYSSREYWYCCYLTLRRGWTEIDLILAILEGLGNPQGQTVDPDSLSLIDALLLLRQGLQQWQSETAIALFLDDVHRISPAVLTWLRTQFCADLETTLARATRNQFLLVVAGRNLRQSGTWPGNNYTYLTPFQRQTLRRVLDEANIPRLHSQLNQALYTTRDLFTNRIYRLTGGHPSTSIKLVQALKNQTWQPEAVGILVNHIDFQAFQTHVAQELAQLTQGVEAQYTRYFPRLLVFRMLNSSIVLAVRRKLGFQETNAPLKQMKVLTAQGLVIEESRSTYRLNPVLRQGHLAQLMLSQGADEQEAYKDLHRFAQQVYQGLNLKTNDPGRIQDYLKESLYHCLCLYPEGGLPHLMQCLRQGLQVSADLEEDFQEEPQEILRDLIRDDEDIQALLQEHHLSWENVVNWALELWHSRSGPGLSASLYTFYREYTRNLTLALLDAENQVQGTGFWVQSQNKQPLIMTCAHVVEELSRATGNRVRGRTFGLNSQELELEVLTTNAGNSTPPKIALLRPTQPNLVHWPDSFLELQRIICGDPPPNPMTTLSPTMMNLYSFAFPRSNAKGESLDPLLWDTPLRNGLIRLVNIGKTKLEVGVSGAPVVDLETGQIMGMIQAHPRDLDLGEDSEGVRCIPAPGLVQALKTVSAPIYPPPFLQQLRLERLTQELRQHQEEREALMQRQATTLDPVAEQRLRRYIEQIETKIGQLEQERHLIMNNVEGFPEVDHG